LCDVWSNLNYPDRSSWGYQNSGENLIWLTQVITTMLTNINTSTVGSALPLYQIFQAKGVLANSSVFVSHMAQWLGQASRLNCTNTGFPTYQGQSLASVHSNFTVNGSSVSIGSLLWSQHNAALMQGFDTAGVHPTDQDRIEQILLLDLNTTCNGLDCSANVAEVFIFNTINKTATNPYFGMGYYQTFTVDEAEAGTINLTIGLTYVFHNNGPCVHPLYISTSVEGPNGANLSMITTGVVSPGTYSVCNGGEMTFTPPLSLRGAVLYYQCVIHTYMGGRIQICDKVINGSCVYNTTTAPPTTQSTTARASTTTHSTTKPSTSSAEQISFLGFLLFILVSFVFA